MNEDEVKLRNYTVFLQEKWLMESQVREDEAAAKPTDQDPPPSNDHVRHECGRPRLQKREHIRNQGPRRRVPPGTRKSPRAMSFATDIKYGNETALRRRPEDTTDSSRESWSTVSSVSNCSPPQWTKSNKKAEEAADEASPSVPNFSHPGRQKSKKSSDKAKEAAVDVKDQSDDEGVFSMS